MNKASNTVLMAVYNHIDYDGRVQRCAESLGTEYKVFVLSLDSGLNYQNPNFESKAVKLDTARGLKSQLKFWQKFINEARNIRPRVVHAHDFFLPFPGWIAAKAVRAKFVYDAHELIIPDKNQILSKRDNFFYLLEKWTVKRADLVIAANENRAELMRQHYRLKSTPLAIRNIPPIPTFKLDPKQLADAYSDLALDSGNIFRIVYQGDMNRNRGIGTFIQAMKYLDTNVRLIMVGGGPDLDYFKAQAEKDGVAGRVSFIGKVPRDHLFSILSACDAGIVTYPYKGLNNIYCAPNKLYEYAQAGLPIVATSQPPIKSIIDEYKIGEIIDCDNFEDNKIPNIAAECIRRILSNPEQYKDNIPRLLSEHNWDSESKRLIEAYSELIG